MNGQWERNRGLVAAVFSATTVHNTEVFSTVTKNCSTRLTSDTTSLQSDSLATVLECFSYWIHFISPILKMTPGRSHERPGKGVAYLRSPSRLIRSL